MADKRKHSLMPVDTRAWLSDPRINALSLIARGVWITMLCYMWESSKRGMLVRPNNAPYTMNELVVLVGCTNDEPIQELVDCGVLSLNHQGVYYSAEMVKQADISEKRRNAGKKGGDAMKQRIEKDKAPLVEKPVEAPTIPTEPTPPKPKQAQEQPLFPNDTDKGNDDAPPPLTKKQQQQADKKKKYHYAENVTLSKDEYAKLCEQHGEEATKRMIEILDNYKGSKGVRYKSDYRTILNWVVDRYYEENMKYGTQRQTNSTAQNTGRGVENNTGYASRAVSPNATAGGSSDGTAQKDYSERF